MQLFFFGGGGAIAKRSVAFHFALLRDSALGYRFETQSGLKGSFTMAKRRNVNVMLRSLVGQCLL